MKKLKILTIIFLATLSISACSMQNNNSITTNEKSAESKENITEDASGEYEEPSTLLTAISKEEFETKVNNDETFWVYVGRPNCPDCQKYYTQLVEYLENNSLEILYFNTRVKVAEKADMTKYLNNLGIDEIPAVLNINNGDVIRVYDMQKSDDILDFEEEYKSHSIQEEK